MNPTEIKSIMAQIGGGANKRLGQHFLIDPSVLQAIVEAAGISKGDRVLEIGPGLGVLTNSLLERGANVVAIERDRRFISYLEGLRQAQAISYSLSGVASDATKSKGVLQIIQGDAAKMDWSNAIGKGSWKFVSNLPYAITSLALRKALWNTNPPTVVVALVQREVAERAISVGAGSPRPGAETAPLRKGKTSLLSLMVALASKEAKIVKRVGRGAFFPAPKVESAILKIVPMTINERKTRWGIDPEEIMKIAKVGFAHPRKLLASNLKTGGAHIHAPLRDIGIPEKARAEDLSPDDWAKITNSRSGKSP